MNAIQEVLGIYSLVRIFRLIIVFNIFPQFLCVVYVCEREGSISHVGNDLKIENRSIILTPLFILSHVKSAQLSYILSKNMPPNMTVSATVEVRLNSMLYTALPNAIFF